MNKYCGPAVLSILTGKSTDECARVISKINGNYNVAGVQLSHLLEAANRMGFECIPAMTGNSLYGTLIRLANEDGMYLVTVPNHFVMIEVRDNKAFFCDNHTKEPIPASSSARLGQSVLFTHKITERPRPPEPILLVTEYEAIIIDSGIFVDKIMQYDQPEYNKKEQIGGITVKNKEELNLIIEAIRRKI